jgi:hypothetical protein
MPRLLGLYALPPARGAVIATLKTKPSVVGAPHGVEIEAPPRPSAPKKPETGYSEQTFTSGERYVMEAAIGLRGAELLIRPARIVMGATVFVIGVLADVGIAAWMMPPI